MTKRFPKSLDLAMKPTPIERIRNFPQVPQGFEIFVKRDDLTEFYLSGNKIRKLEFIFYDVLKKNADTLITCGGFQSNHARATAILGTRFGLKSVLVLFGENSPVLDGNLFLNELVGAEIKYIPQDRYGELEAIMEEVSSKLKKEGKKPYIVPEGASNELGVWGYIKASWEIKKQLEKRKLKIDKIITAVGSGGTYAGLFLGSKIFDWEVQIYGFNVKDTAQIFVDRIYELMMTTKEKFKLKVNFEKEEIKIIDGYVGKGYAKSRKEELDLIKSVAENTGIILDPVYTGKAMYGLLDQLKRGRFSPEDKILFLHTGGGFGLFPIKESFFY
ncbi:MAG: D-cysteine desulfhydrase family protein [candidate division Zixibacteria bacterium]|nr:D-cysteine desulfhydrase family protein [candidate division Zixibacteria bacterium]